MTASPNNPCAPPPGWLVRFVASIAGLPLGLLLALGLLSVADEQLEPLPVVVQALAVGAGVFLLMANIVVPAVARPVAHLLAPDCDRRPTSALPPPGVHDPGARVPHWPRTPTL